MFLFIVVRNFKGMAFAAVICGIAVLSEQLVLDILAAAIDKRRLNILDAAVPDELPIS